MSTSQFFILMGSTHNYYGDGIRRINAMNTFYDDKGCWCLEYGNRTLYRWFSQNENNIFHDALLMASLYLLESQIDREGYELINVAKKLFKNNLYNHKEAIELPGKIITKSNVKKLYNINKETLHHFHGLKFVSVHLDSNSLKIGGFQASNLTDQFKETLDEYKIKNYELCSTFFASFYDIMSNKVDRVSIKNRNI